MVKSVLCELGRTTTLTYEELLFMLGKMESYEIVSYTFKTTETEAEQHREEWYGAKQNFSLGGRIFGSRERINFDSIKKELAKRKISDQRLIFGVFKIKDITIKKIKRREDAVIEIELLENSNIRVEQIFKIIGVISLNSLMTLMTIGISSKARAVA